MSTVLRLTFNLYALQLHKVCARATGDGQAAHNDHVLLRLHQLILKQAPANDSSSVDPGIQ